MQRRSAWADTERPDRRTLWPADDGLWDRWGQVSGRTDRTRSKTIPQVGDADEVWYDPGSNRYYFAHSTAGAAEATSARSGAIGVVDAATDAFVTDISIEGAGVHSVAVNAHNKHIFAPIAGKGILVITLGE